MLVVEFGLLEKLISRSALLPGSMKRSSGQCADSNFGSHSANAGFRMSVAVASVIEGVILSWDDRNHESNCPGSDCHQTYASLTLVGSS